MADKRNINVREMVVAMLTANGYDGLYDDDMDGCGCLLDNIAPCGEINEDCIAGYKQSCADGDSYIGPTKAVSK